MSEPNPSEVGRERHRRIAELEERLSRAPSVGVLPPVAAAAFIGGLAVLWMLRGDLAYFFSPREPIDLGVEGAYRFDVARSNRYAQIHGVPTARGVYWEEGGATWVAVGVMETPLLVKRRALESERWTPGQVGPQPDQRPFSVRGRLQSRAEASRFESAFLEVEKAKQVNPRWLLEAELRPGTDLTVVLWFTLLTAFVAVNGWLATKGSLAIIQRWRRRTPTG